MEVLEVFPMAAGASQLRIRGKIYRGGVCTCRVLVPPAEMLAGARNKNRSRMYAWQADGKHKPMGVVNGMFDLYNSTFIS